ncbi:hypothetical protein HME9302_00031 [Alteripontixanthobacter maritimus]|uniref:DUF4326 domain-containing protein n=2 Tax=Alteripontixanthobacter maritimus TaxID=2161824 RepID=A0A369Q5V4_9SPHN|nr:hypothetical protein HME9302_01005 [Alteripontixanthobacter maritimus]RDC66580.1 hypothetical protein HME9302_00031 [Alteripontixanthobacter maritimus]
MTDKQINTRPVRVQLSRKKGWRLPPNTASVARPHKWGNPFVLEWNERLRRFQVIRGGLVLHQCKDRFEAAHFAVSGFDNEIVGNLPVEELRGKNLACWCRLDQPCHADVLLELANPTPSIKAHGGAL